MHRLRSIFRTIVFLGICLLVWSMINISGLIISQQSSNNLLHVPENATFALRIDGRELAEKTLFSIVLESKEDDLIKLLEEVIRNKTNGKQKITNTGINFLTDLIIFKVPFQGKEVNGILVNLLHQSTYLKNMPNLLEKNQVIAAQNNIGLILTSDSERISTRERNELLKLAKSIVSQKNTEHHPVFQAGSASNRFSEIHFHTTSADKKKSEVNLVFEQKELAFQLNGHLTKTETINGNYLSHELKPNGFHISSRIFEKSWSDSLSHMLSFFSTDIPEILAFSLNYRGTTIINHSSGFLAIPDIDLVVQCKNAFDISAFFHNPQLTALMDCQLSDSSIRFEDETLYFKQLTTKSFYLGKSSTPAYQEQKDTILLSVQGSLNPLINIKGGGFMTAFLEVIPLYKASKKLANSSDQIAFTISKTSKNKAKITGELVFKKGHYPMSEIMRFLLIGQIVN